MTYCLLLQEKAVDEPSPEVLRTLFEEEQMYVEHYTPWYKQNKKMYYHNVFSNLTVGQFIELTHAESITDLCKVLRLDVNEEDIALNDARRILLLNQYVKDSLENIGNAMAKASVDALPEESGLESLRDPALRDLHLLDFVRKEFHYQTYKEAESHPLEEVIVLMNIQSENERYRRALEKRIMAKHTRK